MHLKIEFGWGNKAFKEHAYDQALSVGKEVDKKGITMKLDINTVLKDMVNVAKTTLKGDGASLGKEAASVLEQNNASIAELINARALGEIDQEELESELAREKKVLEIQLISLNIASKAAIQKAMTAAMSSLTSAVSAAL